MAGDQIQDSDLEAIIGAKQQLPEFDLVISTSSQGDITISDVKFADFLNTVYTYQEVGKLKDLTTSELYGLALGEANTTEAKGHNSNYTADAAKELLVQKMQNDQLLDLIEGRSVTLEGLNINPLHLNLNSAIIGRAAQTPKLREALGYAITSVRGSSYVRDSLFQGYSRDRRLTHENYSYQRYLESRLRNIYSGVEALHSPSMLSQQIYAELDHQELRDKVEWARSKLLADNSLSRGTALSRIPYLGREWRQVRDFQREVIPQKLKAIEEGRRRREALAELDQEEAMTRSRIKLLKKQILDFEEQDIDEESDITNRILSAPAAGQGLSMLEAELEREERFLQSLNEERAARQEEDSNATE
jgi:hypothetical protein